MTDNRYREMAERIERLYSSGARRTDEEARRRREQVQALLPAVEVECNVWWQHVDRMVYATGRQVPYRVQLDGQTFTVTIGLAMIAVELGADGWRVVKQDPATLWSAGAGPLDLTAHRSAILDQMLEHGLHDLFSGRVDPAPQLRGQD